MPYLLDTDTISALMLPRPNPAVVRRVGSTPPDELSSSAITLGELLYGAERRNNQRLLRLIPQILAGLSILPFDEASAQVFGPLKAELERRGTPLDEADLRIAAIGLTHGLTLVTGNTHNFARVPRLDIENWIST